MGYLICDKCGGYYELQPGEKPEDFSNECECGGELFYSDSLDVIVENNEDIYHESKNGTEDISEDIYSGSSSITGDIEDENILNEKEPLNNKGKSIEDYRASFKDKSIIKQMKLATEVQEILETKGHYIIKGNGTVKFIKITNDGIKTDDGEFIRFEDIITIEEIEYDIPKQKISSEKSTISTLFSTGYQIFAPKKVTLKIRFTNGEIELKDVKKSDAIRCVSFVKRRLNKVNS